MPDYLVIAKDLLRTYIMEGDTPEQAKARVQQVLGDEAEEATHAAFRAYMEENHRLDRVRMPTIQADPNPGRWYQKPEELRGWIHWPAYRGALQRKGWKLKNIENIDLVTDRLMRLLPAPGVIKYATRGLVIGCVQSGKTANFTGLISKAADCKIRFIMVLSGITNTLRRQTQIRLEKDLTSLPKLATCAIKCV